MKIVLIGYRGSGKTSLGKLLADETWKDFIDTDDEICKRFGDDSIANIWEKHGEPEFRRVEVEVVRETMTKDETIVALGGGTLMQEGARQAVEEAVDANRVYLFCEPEELARRIEADSRSSATRPSLTAHGGGLDEIRTVLEEREPVYRAVADREFDVTHLDPEKALRYFIKYCMTAD